MNNYMLTLNTTLPENGDALTVDLLNVKKASLILRAINHKLRNKMQDDFSKSRPYRTNIDGDYNTFLS